VSQLNRFGIAAAAAAAMSFVSVHAAQYGGQTPPVSPAAARPAAQQDQNPSTALGASLPTPRTADGHPDLSGMWGGGGGGGGAAKPDEKGNLTVLQRGRPCSKQQFDAGNCAPGINFERDSGVTQRMGPPAKIVQTPTEVILLYAQGNQFRVIPIDGRPHDPIKSQDTTWYGDAVGKWDGDTLVVDIVGFNDESWIEWPGWFHSNNMHVTEKFTRTGNTLRWEAIVEDPDVLTQPYHVRGRTVQLNPNAKATLTEDLPCEERDSQHMVTHERG
jgi:hypothetical protein